MKTLGELLKEIVANNEVLFQLLGKLSPQDRLLYLPRILRIVEETKELANSIQHNEDIPSELFNSHQAQ